MLKPGTENHRSLGYVPAPLVLLLLLVPLLQLSGDAGAPGPAASPHTRNSGVDPIPLPLDLAEVNARMLILCPEIFAEEMVPYTVHRTRMGLPSELYVIEHIEENYTGVDRQQKVHNFLRDIHDGNPDFGWLLIMGDSEFLMPRKLWHYAQERGQMFGNYYYSDVYYAGLDSDWNDDGDDRFGEFSASGEIEGDLEWDVRVGRVPASDETDVLNFTGKLIRYEINPPLGDWMKRYLMWGSVMEPPNREGDEFRYIDYKSNAYKVCQQVKEEIPDGIELEELYDYPQIEGGNYTPGDGRDTLFRENMVSQFNYGASMLNFVGQARYDATALNEYGPPHGDGEAYLWNEPMTYNDHRIFTNGDQQPFMYASTCDTARFYYGDMTLETWVNCGSGGVIGLISSTGKTARGEEEDRSWGNWYLDRKFWDLFLNEGISRPGEALFTLKDIYREKWLKPTMSQKETVMGSIYTYVLLGDPWVDIYTDRAKRFMLKEYIGETFYQGNHTIRVQVRDRDNEPVPFPRMTFFNSRVYETFTGSGDGWVNVSLDLKDSETVNVTITAHNMVAFRQKYQVLEAIPDPAFLHDPLNAEPADADFGEEVNISAEVWNLGGQPAEDVGLHIELVGGGGDPTIAYRDVELGTIPPLSNTFYNWTWKVRPGDQMFRFFLDSSTQDLDPLNNEASIDFSTPGPNLTFTPSSGSIRPSSTLRPGSPMEVEYGILNMRSVPAPVDLRLFKGDPDEEGTPLTGPVDIGTVPPLGWNNGTVTLSAPNETCFIYLVMDASDRYPPLMTDRPVKSLVNINHPPTADGDLEVTMTEDSEITSVRIDDSFEDPDNTTEQLHFSFETSPYLNIDLDRKDGGPVHLLISPISDWSGETYFNVSVSDGLGTLTIRVNVSVLPINDPPYFLDTVDGRIEISMLEDSPFTFTLRALDPEGGHVTFYADDVPFDLDVMNGTVEWTPGQNDVGVHTFTVQVNDSSGSSTRALLVLTVSEVNDPPVVITPGDVEVELGETVEVEIEVTDEEGDELLFGTSSPLAWIDDEGICHVNGTAEYGSSNTVRIEVSDGLHSVYVSFNVTVLGVEDEDEETSAIKSQYIPAAVGIALAVLAVLIVGFVLMKGTAADRKVEDERSEADEMYQSEMDEAAAALYGNMPDIEDPDNREE